MIFYAAFYFYFLIFSRRLIWGIINVCNIITTIRRVACQRAYGRLSESALTPSSLKQARQFKNPSNVAPFSTWSQCPSLKGTEKDGSPVSRYKAALLHCHLQIQASHCENGRKTKKRKKKGKRNWVIDKRASSGVGLRNVFITAQKGFEECFRLEKCVNCRVLDTSLSLFPPFLYTVITEYVNSAYYI